MYIDKSVLRFQIRSKLDTKKGYHTQQMSERNSIKIHLQYVLRQQFEVVENFHGTILIPNP